MPAIVLPSGLPRFPRTVDILCRLSFTLFLQATNPSYCLRPPPPLEAAWPLPIASFALSTTYRPLLHLSQTAIMASNGSNDAFTPDTVLAAMTTMRGGEPDKKKVAMDYLSRFQKSVRTALRHDIPFGMQCL